MHAISPLHRQLMHRNAQAYAMFASIDAHKTGIRPHLIRSWLHTSGGKDSLHFNDSELRTCDPRTCVLSSHQ